MYRALMVPLDGSNFGERALPLALALARHNGATIHLVNVSGPSTRSSAEYGGMIAAQVAATELNDDMTRYVERVRQRCLAVATDGVVATVATGEPGEALDEYIAAQTIDIVVMSTHGRGGMNRAWLGSVAEEVTRRSRVPVLLVRPDEDVSPELGAPVTINRILVPLKESDFSEAILPHAQTVADTLGAELMLMEVVVPVAIHARALTAPVLDVDTEELAAKTKKSETYLASVAARAKGDGRSVRTRVVTAPQVPHAIIRTAEEADAGIIAMTTHARHGLSRMLLGSVADKVVRGTTRAVLLLRPQ